MDGSKVELPAAMNVLTLLVSSHGVHFGEDASQSSLMIENHFVQDTILSSEEDNERSQAMRPLVYGECSLVCFAFS